MTLKSAKMDTCYIIASVQTQKLDIENFLISLGCYPGERIYVLGRFSENTVVSIRNARYSIDDELANHILITPAFMEQQRKRRRRRRRRERD